ncbi:DUF2637 domain-containing protein [Streptomyces sp. NPDC058001]|uniref:DUF2637 domain-containing protein n=1 Tax=Streptomyces sp. NPDC058001 TaxID=3346300 RepID=UPI0036EC3914
MDIGHLAGKQPTAQRRGRAIDLDAVLRRGCALVVSAVAAYASYVHQRSFAIRGGADQISATLWPLSVDGLLLLATVGLLNGSSHSRGRARFAIWSAFLLGIVVSLAANIAAAPSLAWQPVLVAGWPPVALLLAVELLTHSGPADSTCTPPRHQHSPGATDALADDPPDPMLIRALEEDALHRDRTQRPISAETLRKELHISAAKSRRLVAEVRSMRNGHGVTHPSA